MSYIFITLYQHPITMIDFQVISYNIEVIVPLTPFVEDVLDGLEPNRKRGIYQDPFTVFPLYLADVNRTVFMQTDTGNLAIYNLPCTVTVDDVWAKIKSKFELGEDGPKPECETESLCPVTVMISSGLFRVEPIDDATWCGLGGSITGNLSNGSLLFKRVSWPIKYTRSLGIFRLLSTKTGGYLLITGTLNQGTGIGSGIVLSVTLIPSTRCYGRTWVN